jgi:hypothetical protein
VVSIAGRGAVVCADAIVLGAQFDRDIEVLGPEARRRRRVDGGRCGAEMGQDRRGEAVPIAQRPRCGWIDLERLIPELRIGGEQPWDRIGRCGEAAQRDAPLAGALGVNQLGALDPDLVAEAAVLEDRRAETARRRLQRDLVVRLAGRGDNSFGDEVQRGNGGGEAGGKRSQSRQIVQEATGSSGGSGWRTVLENCIASSSSGLCLIARVSNT